jgi:hypothetical protein
MKLSHTPPQGCPPVINPPKLVLLPFLKNSAHPPRYPVPPSLQLRVP